MYQSEAKATAVRIKKEEGSPRPRSLYQDDGGEDGGFST
jgi:hypothetical protein